MNVSKILNISLSVIALFFLYKWYISNSSISNLESEYERIENELNIIESKRDSINLKNLEYAKYIDSLEIERELYISTIEDNTKVIDSLKKNYNKTKIKFDNLLRNRNKILDDYKKLERDFIKKDGDELINNLKKLI